MDTAINEVAKLDSAVDACWEKHLRGKPTLDRLAYALSESANHSMLWHALGTAQAVMRRDPRSALRLSLTLGVEAAVVNGILKSVVGRDRPRQSKPRPHPLRQPRTSSFPSGHASAAMTAASMLSSGSRWKPLWYALAFAVAISRVHVRIHHASDVIAGIATGATLGALARRFVR